MNLNPQLLMSTCVQKETKMKTAQFYSLFYVNFVP